MPFEIPALSSMEMSIFLNPDCPRATAIQDMVEVELMNSPRKEVAKRYIAYRDKRSIARRAKTRDMFLEIIEAKSNDITRENANMNTDSPAGMMMKFLRIAALIFSSLYPTTLPSRLTTTCIIVFVDVDFW